METKPDTDMCAIISSIEILWFKRVSYVFNKTVAKTLSISKELMHEKAETSKIKRTISNHPTNPEFIKAEGLCSM